MQSNSSKITLNDDTHEVVISLNVQKLPLKTSMHSIATSVKGQNKSKYNPIIPSE